MKKLLAIIIAIAALVLPVQAQAAHSAALSWAAPSDAITTTTYNVYRLAGSCPTAPLTLPLPAGWSKLTNVSALSYTDSTITVGSWCYMVTQVTNSIESNPSNTAGGQAKPGVVTFSVVIQ